MILSSPGQIKQETEESERCGVGGRGGLNHPILRPKLSWHVLEFTPLNNGDFSAHMGRDSDTRRGVTGRTSLLDPSIDARGTRTTQARGQRLSHLSVQPMSWTVG